MRLSIYILSGLFILAAIPHPSNGSETTPDQSYLTDLHQRYTSIAAREPDAQELLNTAIKRSGLQSSQDLIGQVKFCDEVASRVAGVTHSRETRFYFLARELDESPLKESELKTHYLDRNKEFLPADAKMEDFRWEIGADFIRLVQNSDKRQICIKAGVEPQAAVELLAHELVHYAHTPDFDKVPDILSFTDFEEFASKGVAQPGEEIEAYKMQFSLAIRGRGKRAVTAPPYVLQAFSESGQFVGQESDLSRYILDELQYRQKRFKPEYEDALRNALKQDEQQIELEKKILQLRSQQEREFQAMAQERYRILDFFLSSYRATTENLKRLLKLSTESKERLTHDIEERSSRCGELRRRIELTSPTQKETQQSPESRPHP